jgi:hypothetical protein
MKDENAPDKLSPDQAQLLAHVTLTEQSIGTGHIEADEHGNPIDTSAPPGNPSEENKAILATLIAILTPAMPFLEECYPPDTIERIANAYTAVEEKYGWNVRGMMGVEVQLAIVAIPPTIQAIVLGRAYFAAKKRDAEKVINQEEGAQDGSHQ